LITKFKWMKVTFVLEGSEVKKGTGAKGKIPVVMLLKKNVKVHIKNLE